MQAQSKKMRCSCALVDEFYVPCLNFEPFSFFPFPFLFFWGKLNFWIIFFEDGLADHFFAMYLHVTLGVGSFFLEMNWWIDT